MLMIFMCSSDSLLQQNREQTCRWSFRRKINYEQLRSHRASADSCRLGPVSEGHVAGHDFPHWLWHVHSSTSS